jgi:hypothetical protein
VVLCFIFGLQKYKKSVSVAKLLRKNYVFSNYFSNFAIDFEKNKNYFNTIMDLTGRIIAILQAQSGVSARTGNAWMSQEYVLEVPGTYPRKMVFRIFGEDRIKQFNIQVGEELTVQFDIDSREVKGRWYNDIRAYNVVRQQRPAQTPQTVDPLPFDVGGDPFPPFMEQEGTDAPF